MNNKSLILASIIAFILGFSTVIPVFTKMFEGDEIEKLLAVGDEVENTGDPVDPLADVKLEPYIYVTSDRVGGFNKWVVNETFYRSWLNDTVVWTVEKGVQKDKEVIWTKYDKFFVKKDWNSKNLSEKHTVIVDSDEDAFYRILTNTQYNADLISYEDLSAKEENSSNDMVMKFKVTDTHDYNLVYNWDDYLSSDIADKTVFSKQVKSDTSNKQSFEWMVVSTVKIAKGEQFILDPYYGIIADAVVDSWEWDAGFGLIENPDAFVRIGDSNYFMTTAADASVDGVLTVIEVSDAGIITESVIDTWEYDNSDGRYGGILHIADDIYAVYYMDASNGVLFTTRVWSNNGTLQKTIIDSETYTKPIGQHLIHVTGDIYALSYQEFTGWYDHFLETYEITSDGAISARIDVVEYDSSSNDDNLLCAPHMALVDSNTVAIVMANNARDGRLYTYNISAAGDITNNYADYWEFDGTNGEYPHIKKISGNVFAISHRGTDYDGFVNTLTIADTGAITKSWIDSLEFETADCYYPNIFTVADASVYNPGVYGITYKGTDFDGFVKTMNITSAGDIGTVIDSLEFDTADTLYYSPTIHVAGDIYAICYSSTSADGWAATVNITTPSDAPANNAPTITGPSPTNQSTGISLQPRIHAIVTDADAETMTCNFYTSPDGSAWTWIQSNSTVASGTNISAPYTGASAYSTKYYWKLTADDGTDNTTSDIYEFTTEALVKEYQEIESWTGSLYSTADSNEVESWIGELYTTSTFNEVELWSGELYSTSSYNEVESWTGSLYSSADSNEIESWTGSLQGTAASYNEVESWTGSLTGTTVDFSEVESWTGELYTTGIFETVETWTGGLYATVAFNDVESYTGSFYNISHFIEVEEWTGGLYNSLLTYTYTENFDDDELRGLSYGNPDERWYDALVTGTRGNISDQTYTSGTHSMFINGTSVNPNIIVFNLTNTTELTNFSWDIMLYNSPYSTDSDIILKVGDAFGNEPVAIRYSYNPAGMVFLTYWEDNVETVLTNNWGSKGKWYCGEYVNFNWTDYTFKLVSNGTDYGWLGMNITAGINTTYLQFGGSGFGATDQFHNVFIDNVSITGTEVLTPGWMRVEIFDGNLYNIAAFNEVESWAGTLTGTSAAFSEIESWSGQLYTTSAYNEIESWMGILTGTSADFTEVETWVGSFSGTSGSFNEIESWSGGLYTTSSYSEAESWTGQLYTTSIFNTVESWSGTLRGTSALYNEIESWTGGLYTVVTFNEIESWIGGLYSTSDFSVIESWTGLLIATIDDWQEVESWSGGLYNISVYNEIETWTGGLYNNQTPPSIAAVYPANNSIRIPDTFSQFYITITDADGDLMGYHAELLWEGCDILYDPESDWNANGTYGMIYNTGICCPLTHGSTYTWNVSVWDGQDWVNEIFYFTVADWHEVESWIGTLTAKSAVFTEVESWTGTLTGKSGVFTEVETWTGELYSTASYNEIESWTGSLYNTAPYIEIESWTGSLYTTATFNEVETWVGTLTGTDAALTEVDSWTGGLYATADYNEAESWTGRLYSEASYNLVETWTGILTATSEDWQDIETWIGGLYSTAAFNIIETWTGGLYNTTSYNEIETWAGNLTGTGAIFTEIESWIGGLYNSSHWTEIEQWTGGLYNTSSFNVVENWTGNLSSIVSWNDIESWTGGLYNVSGITVETWTGSLRNLSAAATMECTLSGVTITCTYTGSTDPDYYRWETRRNAAPAGDSGWCPDCPSQSWTYEDGGLIDIVFSINDTGYLDSAATSIYITSADNVTRTEDPTFYTDAESCVSAGFYWWDQQCQNCTRPYEWDTEEEPPEAGDRDLITILSRPEISLLILFALLIVFTFYFKQKGGKKRRKK